MLGVAQLTSPPSLAHDLPPQQTSFMNCHDGSKGLLDIDDFKTKVLVGFLRTCKAPLMPIGDFAPMSGAPPWNIHTDRGTGFDPGRGQTAGSKNKQNQVSIPNVH